MAVRTTAVAVRGILLSGVGVGDDLTPFIATASSIVDDVCTSSGYDAAKLEMIERLLSAHCYAMDMRRTQAEGIASGPSEHFDRLQLKLGLNNTPYGQMAINCDTAGNLAALQNAQEIVVAPLPQFGARSGWLGTDPFAR